MGSRATEEKDQKHGGKIIGHHRTSAVERSKGRDDFWALRKWRDDKIAHMKRTSIHKKANFAKRGANEAVEGKKEKKKNVCMFGPG